MKEIKILFTGVGRRVELIEAFKNAAFLLGIKLKIYGADITDTAPALAFCDRVCRVCGMREPGYIDELSKICKDECIDIVIPTIDTDLLVLSQNKSLFGDTKVLVSSPEFIAACRDKNLTADFFKNCGCLAPRTYDAPEKYDGPYPCFIKPRDGSSSTNAFRVDSSDDLVACAKRVENSIVQPYINGDEYTVDIFCDLCGEPIFITPRVRMAVRSGEVLKTRIDMDAQIIDECRRIARTAKPVGPITVQLIREKNTGLDYFIEINPRFGGGSPLSMRAGANSAEALLRILIGMPQSEHKVVGGAIFSRFDMSVRIPANSGDHLPIRGVIFDLDDTLYSEREYVTSGYRALACYLGDVAAESELTDYFERGLPAIDEYLLAHGIKSGRDECLAVYRKHVPNISLYHGVAELISELRQKGIKVGIITDGRPAGQKNKLCALGLYDLVDDIIITDELGGEQFRKPCDIAFRIMQRRWAIPMESIIYVGDNAQKDFSAPLRLSMQALHFENSDGLYKSEADGVESACDFESIAEILRRKTEK